MWSALAAWLLILLVPTGVPAAAQETAAVDGHAATVQRISGPARADTAAELARATTADPAVIYLVAGTDFADGLAAGALAARRGGVVLLLDPGGVPRATAEHLRAHPGTEVVVVGGTRRLPAARADEVAAITGSAPQRIAGDDRYATAGALAAAAGDTDVVYLVAGRAPADALAAGAAAAHDDAVLLLTASTHLPAPTSTALQRLRPARVVVVGGPAVVGDAVLADIGRIVGADRVHRIAGGDRYATAAAVADRVFGAPASALVATGRGWVDALAATPLAARVDAPVLLVPRRCVPDPAVDILRGVGRLVIAGGDHAVSPRVEGLFACRDEIATVSPTELGASWRPGCPVPVTDLRRVVVDHHRIDGGGVRTGDLVVHRSVAPGVVRVFDALFEAGFPMDRVANVADYGADDDTAMAANATTAFNCRAVTGSPGVWSEHSYGTAIDVNPVQNPYVAGRTVLPPAGRAYLDRSDARPGMVVANGPVERAFAAAGWRWGGRWRSVKDYQHFSISGR